MCFVQPSALAAKLQPLARRETGFSVDCFSIRLGVHASASGSRVPLQSWGGWSPQWWSRTSWVETWGWGRPSPWTGLPPQPPLRLILFSRWSYSLALWPCHPALPMKHSLICLGCSASVAILACSGVPWSHLCHYLPPHASSSACSGSSWAKDGGTSRSAGFLWLAWWSLPRRFSGDAPLLMDFSFLLRLASFECPSSCFGILRRSRY